MGGLIISTVKACIVVIVLTYYLCMTIRRRHLNADLTGSQKHVGANFPVLMQLQMQTGLFFVFDACWSDLGKSSKCLVTL